MKIPLAPCWYCGRLTVTIQFVKGNACCYEHFMKREKE